MSRVCRLPTTMRAKSGRNDRTIWRAGVFCSDCGAEVDDKAERCGNCGRPLAVAPVGHASLNQPQMLIVRSGKNAGLAAVLCFLVRLRPDIQRTDRKGHSNDGGLFGF